MADAAYCTVCEFDFCDGRHEGESLVSEDSRADPGTGTDLFQQVQQQSKGIQIPLDKIVSIESELLRWPEIPPSLRWKLNRNPNIDYVDPGTYGSQWWAFNGGWCKTTLLDLNKDCEKGAICAASHCPPNRAAVNLLISMGDLGIQFVSDCLETYYIKYHVNGILPVLHGIRQGKRIQSFPRTAKEGGMWEKVDQVLPDAFAGSPFEGILDEWDRLGEEQKELNKVKFEGGTRKQKKGQAKFKLQGKKW